MAKISNRKVSRLRSTLAWSVLLVAASCMVIYGADYFIRRHRALSPAVLSHANTISTAAAGSPSEAPIDVGTTDYNVGSDMPRLIRMPSIKAEGFVQQVGVDAKINQMATPSSIHMAGWYINSVKPGDDGLSIMDGHVSGYYSPGIFKDIKKLHANETFLIENGDHSTRTFKVVRVSSYPLEEAAKQLFIRDPSIKQQLNLITCGGAFNKATQQYQERVIVVAERV